MKFVPTLLLLLIWTTGAQAAASFVPPVNIIYDEVLVTATLIVFEHEGYSSDATNHTATYENPRQTIVVTTHAVLKHEGGDVIITAEYATIYGPVSDERALAAGTPPQKTTGAHYEIRISADTLIQINGQVIKAAAAAKLFPEIPPSHE